MDYRSFSDPETHFLIVTSDTPVSVDGYAKGEPTGEIRCASCGRKAGAPEYIPHEHGCPQADVKSRYYAQTH